MTYFYPRMQEMTSATLQEIRVFSCGNHAVANHSWTRIRFSRLLVPEFPDTGLLITGRRMLLKSQAKGIREQDPEANIWA